MSRRRLMPTMVRLSALGLLLTLSAARPPRQAQHVTVPAGTTFMVKLLTELSTRQREGTRFEAVLQEDIRAGNVVVVHAGAPLYGTITRSDGGKKVGKQKLAATLTDIKLKGRLVPIVTDTAGASEKYGGGLAMVGGGSLVGAVIAGGGGAVVGGVLGAAGSAASKGRHITVPAGTIAQVHLRAPLNVP